MADEAADVVDDRIISSRMFGQRALEALGLSGQHVCAFTIDVQPNEAAKVTIERMLTWDETSKLVPILEEYELVREVTDLESTERTYQRA
jgi:hypothetical protein